MGFRVRRMTSSGPREDTGVSSAAEVRLAWVTTRTTNEVDVTSGENVDENTTRHSSTPEGLGLMGEG